MKKILLLAVLLLPFTLLAQSADELFEQKNIAQALQKYEEQLNTATGVSLYKAQLRVIASQFMLGEYMHAAKNAYTYPLPKDSLWKARFLLYRIATAQRVQNMYRPALPQADEQSDDLENLSSAQWDDKINESFDALWALRKDLINAPIADETLILNTENTDTLAIPTLFDFVVLQWKDRLQNSPVMPLRAADVLTLSYKDPVPQKNDLKKLIAILAEAAKLGGKNRADARIIWEADRLTLPLEQESNFTFDNKDKQRSQAIELLQMLSGYKSQKKSFLSKLGLSAKEKAVYGQSYAALQAATWLNNYEEYAQAVALCDWAVAQLGENYYTQSCANLAAQIRQPQLSVKPAAASQDPAHTELQVSARNAEKVWMKLYEISAEDLKEWNQANNHYSWDYLTYISSDKIPQLVKRQPLTIQEKNISYEKPHAYAEQTFTLPPLTKRGFYAAVFSTEPQFTGQQTALQATVLNATDLAMFVTTGIEDNPAGYHTTQLKTVTPKIFRIYTLDFKTGQPVSNADITYFTTRNTAPSTGRTDANGLLALSRTLQINGKTDSYHITPKATYQGSTAFTPGSVYFNFASKPPVKLFTETDRAIYRPGQEVQLAVYGFEEASRGFKTLANKQVTLVLRDTNYEKVLEKTLSLNAYGTAKTSFTLPETGLLGTYHVKATYKAAKRDYTSDASFQVEEYKRPEYEVTLSPASTLQYGKEAHIDGSARYYFGAPLEKATVKYSVKRTIYHPPFWWWRSRPYSQPEVIASGETATDTDGNFTVSFTPQTGSEANWPYKFEVAVSVFDASGRAIDATQIYKAAKQSAFFSTSFHQGFYEENTAGTLAQVKLLDVNSQPIAGKFTAEIVQLENVLPSQENMSSHNSLETWYGQNKELRSVSRREFTAEKDTDTALPLPALSEGIYKLKLTAKNADNVELVFLVAAKQSHLALPAVALAQYKTYYPGSQAKFLIGAQKQQGPKRLEVYQDGQFLAFSERIGSGVEIYTLPIQNAWRGGIFLRWFGASNYELYSADTQVEVPFDNKELTLSMPVPEAVKPAEKVNWTLTARDAAGHLVNAQATLRVYDKSLDYYRQTEPAFTLQKLFSQASWRSNFSTTDRHAYAQSFCAGTCYLNTFLQAPQMPQLNLQPRWARYNYALGATMKEAAPMLATRAAFAKNAAAEETAMTSADMDDARDVAVAEAAPANEDTNAVRTDFSETAYFNPMLPITGGKGTVSFTMPQSLTAWNIQALAFTLDASIGNLTAQTVTRKDLMVRLSLPRFWRENDQTTLVVQVTNITGKKQNAEVTLDLLLDGKDVAAQFSLEKTTQSVTVPANGNVALTWPVTVPAGVGLLQLTATLRAGNNTDAESRQLPLLPSKKRLAESVTAALDNGTQTLQLKNLLTADDTRAVSAVTLRVDPGLLLRVFNAMPQLLRPGYEDALSLANRYVPLAVVNAFYKTYPLLQTAVDKIPHRDSQTPSWNISDPARLVLLQETPWLQESRGAAERKEFLTDLFDPAAVQKTRTQVENKLASYQTPEGGFTWMPGGKPSEFITLRLLASYAQILRYGGEVPQASAEKALTWIAPRIEKNLTQADASYSAVSYALYAAYVFTAFPQDWKSVRKAPVKKWLDYADKHAAYMTALGQTYAAAAYYRLGENTKAQNYLDLVLSRMKFDPVVGGYFAPEAQSWLWYNDTLTTQTATLQTLLEVRPESDKAADLVKWLLFNRKSQVWQDSAASAQTVYALLDYMRHRGLLDDPAEYQLNWGDKKETLHFEPMDFSEQLSWTQTAENVPAQYYTAQVTKRGGLTGFVTLDAVYTTAHALASEPGVLNVSRRYLLSYQENGRENVRELAADEEIPVGSTVQVELTLSASAAFDFVMLTDPKPTGFENTDLASGWTWDALSYYREVRDGSTNFFLDRVPAGKYVLRYTLRPTLAGHYHALPAQVQSMYAPEFSAHTAAGQLEVKN